MRRKRFYRIISYILVFSLVLGLLNLTEIGKKVGVGVKEVKAATWNADYRLWSQGVRWRRFKTTLTE